MGCKNRRKKRIHFRPRLMQPHVLLREARRRTMGVIMSSTSPATASGEKVM